MTALSFEVITYDIRLARRRDKHVPGNLVRYNASITCHGSAYTLTIYFLDEQSFVPNNAFDPGQKRGTSYLPTSQYQWYVDLLRNEKPVYCFLDSSYPLQNGIYTGAEPVGENEA
jgi:hypothetical protein